LWRQRDRYAQKNGIDLDAVANDLLHDDALHNFRESWKVDPELVRRHLAGVERIEFDEVLRRIYGVWAAREGKPRYGDKTPVFVVALDELAGIFPEARFVHIIRDGRDVALSLLDLAHPDHPRTVGRAAHQWASWVDAGTSAGVGLGPRRYLEVRYETLVSDTEPELRRICDFIELDFLPTMLQPEVRGRTAVPEREQWQHPNLDRPPTAGLRDWRRDMRPHDVAVFEAVAGRTLAAAGYECSVARLPPSVRATAVAVSTRAQLQRAVAWAQNRM
jgi:hypothetical protein